MTAPAERIKEHNRGFRRAEPASRSRLAALDTFGLRYERVDDFNVIIEGRYLLNLGMSYWRSNDDEEGCHGYLVSTLDAEIRKRKSEKPVAGRDSVARPADSDTAAELTFDSGCDAESAAGAVLSGEGAALVLPMVNQWP